MKIYVFEQWMEGEWRPKFIRWFTSFNGALLVLNSCNRNVFLFRVKRIKTPEDLTYYESQGAFLYSKRRILNELWKVRWVKS